MPRLARVRLPAALRMAPLAVALALVAHGMREARAEDEAKAARPPWVARALAAGDAELWHLAQHVPADAVDEALGSLAPDVQIAAARVVSADGPLPWRVLLRLATGHDPDVSLEAAWALYLRLARAAEHLEAPTPGPLRDAEERRALHAGLRTALAKSGQRRPLQRLLGYALAALDGGDAGEAGAAGGTGGADAPAPSRAPDRPKPTQ